MSIEGNNYYDKRCPYAYKRHKCQWLGDPTDKCEFNGPCFEEVLNNQDQEASKTVKKTIKENRKNSRYNRY